MGRISVEVRKQGKSLGRIVVMMGTMGMVETDVRGERIALGLLVKELMGGDCRVDRQIFLLDPRGRTGIYGGRISGHWVRIAGRMGMPVFNGEDGFLVVEGMSRDGRVNLDMGNIESWFGREMVMVVGIVEFLVIPGNKVRLGGVDSGIVWRTRV